MKLARTFAWGTAALPIAAAVWFAARALPLPEAFVDREALGEVSSRWQLADWADATGEPLHVIARVLHLAVLHLPGSTLAGAVFANVVAVLLLVLVMTSVTRRSLGGVIGGVIGSPLALALLAALFASPACTPLWLHGERIGMVVAPLLFAAALRVLAADGAFARRATTALLCVAIAPFCHANGCALAFALLPAILGAARAAGSTRTAAWLGATLLIANVAAALSLRHVASLAVGDADWLGACARHPFDAALRLVQAIGGTWLDAVPGSRLDETCLGTLSLLLPALPWVGANRHLAVSRSAMTWWSCWLGGLAIVVLAALRYDLQPAVGTMRVASYGACLLPIGALGLIATCFGANPLACAAGAMAVLCVQDWKTGVADLAAARTRGEGVMAELLLPEFAGNGAVAALVREPHDLQLLQQRGWLPSLTPSTAADARRAFDADVEPGLGGVRTGEHTAVRGTVHGLAGSTPQWVVVVARLGDAAPQVVGHVRPTLRRTGEDGTWQVALVEPLPDGARVRAVGFLPAERRFARLAGTMIVRGDALVQEDTP